MHTQKPTDGLFETIAPKYDALNRVNSLGMDQRWRKALIRHVELAKPTVLLDLATGTGDLSTALAQHMPSTQIMGTDISSVMMEQARAKAREQQLQNISFMVADAMQLPFHNASYDAVTCSFGVRNFPSIAQGFAEMYRILRPNGMVAILELCQPVNPILKLGYCLHTECFIPFTSSLFGADKAAYRYLVESIKKVPQRAQMQQLMEQAGFVHSSYKVFPLGVCALYIGYK